MRDAGNSGLNPRTFEMVFAAILIVIGIVVTGASVQLGIGGIGSPGPGMLPGSAALMLTGLCGIHFIRIALSEQSGTEQINISAAAIAKLFGIVAIILGATFLIPLFGFFAASTVMLLLLAFLIARISLAPSALMTALVAGSIYLVFAVWLGIPLP